MPLSFFKHAIVAFLIAVFLIGCAVPPPVVGPGAVDVKMRTPWRYTFLLADDDGAHGYFILDTGCNCSVMSAGHFKNLHRQFVGILPVLMPFWFPPSRMFDPPNVQPGPFNLLGLDDVIDFDATAVGELLGVEVCGLLGGDCLSSRIVRFDSDAAKYAILAASTPPTPDWGHESECMESANQFLIPVKISGDTVWCVIDTGSNASLSLPKSVFEKNFGQGAHQYLGAIVSGMEVNRTTIAPKVELLGQVASDVAVDIYSTNKFGLVGLGLLRRFVVTLDYPGKKLYARPGESFTIGDRPESYGITVVRRKGRVLVEFIEPGGAAEHAGVCVGDVVISVNQKPVEKIEFLDESFDGVSEPDRVARLVVLRSDKRLEFAFSPR